MYLLLISNTFEFFSHSSQRAPCPDKHHDVINEVLLFVPITTDPSIHPSIIPLSPLRPVSSLSWFASVSLLDGWGYGFSFFFFFLFMTTMGVSLLWHELKLRMQLLILSCLSYCPWLWITVLYFVKRGKPLLAHAAESAIFFLTFRHSHQATCQCL